ncbi:unnamed protein product [Spodoptera littoralis]|uniref:Uncharacterized protein n=1 Tax=Spodoptera littoralis TaxID=7109 RepID=A0A9P0HVQ0_SPOLI|nr:unnamed protein product [Spodoptera littoralis]CAH1634705.1 unnamed protein product [Spodoptera littoralis]
MLAMSRQIEEEIQDSLEDLNNTEEQVEESDIMFSSADSQEMLDLVESLEIKRKNIAHPIVTAILQISLISQIMEITHHLRGQNTNLKVILNITEKMCIAIVAALPVRQILLVLTVAHLVQVTLQVAHPVQITPQKTMELTSNQVLLLIVSEDRSEQETNKRQSRKRQRNPNEWKQALSKRLKKCGKEYITKRGQTVPAKSLGPPCKSSCRLSCSTKVLPEKRNDIFKSYWALGTHQRQRFSGILRKKTNACNPKTQD